MNCPNMNELSLCFTQQSSDCTDLVTLMDGLGRTCPNLKKMHISSNQLSNEAVCALENANLRYISALFFLLSNHLFDLVLPYRIQISSYSSFVVL
jgi:hypothetical protein